MGAEIGQTSQYHPAVVFDGGSNGGPLYHMLFVSQDSSNRLLYATSRDGQNWDFIGQVAGDTTGAAPAIALSQGPVFEGPPNPNLLVAIYVANDPSNRILYSILDLNDNPSTRGWRDMGLVSGDSAHQVFAMVSGLGQPVNVYFLANDDTQRLLETQFTP